MATAESPSFGALLRQHRLAAGLTQEALAERASLSVHAVSDLERGERRFPYPDTVRRLARALRLSAAERARLGAAVPHRATPPVRPSSAPAPPTNLPAALTSFVGRERDLAEVRRLLGATRLLTLTGPGGVGKSRLALEAARAVAAAYADGVWLVDLAPLREPALVGPAVAAALGVPEQPGRSITETLLAWLGPRRLLLVLDNCEHLVAACAGLAEAALRACPGVAVLTTSREALGLGGETPWRVPSLALPGAADLGDPGRLAGVDAVRLFVERAWPLAPAFALTTDNAATVARICRRLDGLPLAIELAAARVRVLAIDEIAARLDDRFRLLLTGGSRAALPRHRTLWATIDWSHDLLTGPEQALFRRLAVFAGGWTLAAAEAVGAGAGIAEADVLDLLTRLVDQSLVQVDEARTGATRYRLLDTVHQYAAEKLDEAGESGAARDRHRDWCLALAERAEPPVWGGPDQLVWLARLEAEHDNLRAALARCLEADPPVGLHLAGCLWQYWRVRSRYAEGRRWLDACLAQAPERTTQRVKTLLGTAALAVEQGTFPEARVHLEECLALSRALAEPRFIAWTLRHLGGVLFFLGDYARARAVMEEGLIAIRTVDDPFGLGSNLWWLGLLAEREGQYRQARAWLEEALALLRQVGDRWMIGRSLMLLGGVAMGEAEYGRAEALFDEGLAVVQALGAPRMVAGLRWHLGRVAYVQGDLARATVEYEAALTLARDVEDRHEMARNLAGLGQVAAVRGDRARATAALGESLALAGAQRHRQGIGVALHGLGLVAASEGDAPRAAALLRESLALRRESLALRRDLGERPGVAECLEALAAVAAGTGWPDRAARLLGAAEALREAIGAPLPPVDQPGHEATVRGARAALGDDGLAAWAAGRAMTIDAATEEALADPPGPEAAEA